MPGPDQRAAGRPNAPAPVATGRPNALVPVAFALAVALFASLGTWQLWRADQRAESLNQFARGGERAALTAPVDGGRFEEHRYRWLELRGRYLSAKQFLLDSMIHEGRVGHHVLTPLRVADGEPWVIVNRGWIPADPERLRLPDVAVGEEPRVVRARIDALPRPGLLFDDPGTSAGEWPQVLLFPTVAELEARLGTPLAPYQLLLSPGAPDGFVRVWRPRAMPPERHLGYALQWYSLAVALGVIGAVLLWRSRRG